MDQKVEEINRIEEKMKGSISQKEKIEKLKEIEKEEGRDYSLFESGTSNNINRAPKERNNCVCGEGVVFPEKPMRDRMTKKQKNKMKKIATQKQIANKMEREPEDRIVNGYSADARPWMATFAYNGKSVFCGGALINRRYVL